MIGGGSAPPSTETEHVQLRSRVTGLEGELEALTRKFAASDHSWDEERVALEAGRAEASSKANGLALESVQAKAYIHSSLSMEQG